MGFASHLPPVFSSPTHRLQVSVAYVNFFSAVCLLGCARPGHERAHMEGGGAAEPSQIQGGRHLLRVLLANSTSWRAGRWSEDLTA